MEISMGEEFWEVTFYLTAIFGIIGFYFFWRVWPWLSTPFRAERDENKVETIWNHWLTPYLGSLFVAFCLSALIAWIGKA
jgi:hypothetical protein